MKVTQEMRQAVYEIDCAEKGHLPNVGSAIRATSDGKFDVIGPEGQIAHVVCSRCGRVWLLIEDPGNNYAHAELKLKSKMKNPDELKPKNPRKPDRPETPTPTPTPERPRPTEPTNTPPIRRGNAAEK